MLLTGDPTVFVCDGDDHQLEKMFDDDPTFSTYWQSQKSVLADGQITEQVLRCRNFTLSIVNSTNYAPECECVSGSLISGVLGE